MRRILHRTLSYLAFWTVLFLFARAVFLVYHASKTDSLSFIETLKVFAYGFRMDVSFAAYLSALPFLFFLMEVIFRKAVWLQAVRVYTYLLIPVVLLLTTMDLELYQAWGFRLDATPLQYLNTPAEMLASAGSAPIGILVLQYLLFAAVAIWAFRKLSSTWETSPHHRQKLLLELGLSVFLLAFLILPIRGGWQQIPLNQSDVYFSQNVFANHAGVNVPWNVMQSLLRKSYDTKNPYEYLEGKQAQALVQELYTAKSDTIPSLLKSKKPNVLFIILESYTAKLIGPLGGPPDVTPNLNALAKEGILFSNIYSSGDRSEKGMVALLSGYPVQTTTSIIKTPKKTERIPQLASDLKKEGYYTSYYYGGELAFANIKSFLLNGGYDKLVDKSDFPRDSYNSKWGAHDHILLDRVQKDLKTMPSPFLMTVFTLSSHEPFDVPMPARFKGEDDETQFKNSFHYTDWALGRFFQEAKKQPWWQNTLVVLVADHGHLLPGHDANDAPSKFKIPLLMVGGALAVKDTVVTTIGSQTDIVPTLLYQLGLPTAHYAWSKNLLDNKATPFAFYVFNDGFGMITPDGALTFDNVSKKLIQRDSAVTEKQLKQGKAYMQTSFDDFLKK